MKKYLLWFCLLSQPALAQIAISGVELSMNPAAPDVVGVFLRMTNTSEQTEILTGVSAAHFKHAVFHDVVEQNGRVKMVALTQVAVPGKSTVVFRMGGKHVMLTQPKSSLKAGDQVTLVFNLKSGQQIEARATVSKAGNSKTNAHAHQDGHDHHMH